MVGGGLVEGLVVRRWVGIWGLHCGTDLSSVLSLTVRMVVKDLNAVC